MADCTIDNKFQIEILPFGEDGNPVSEYIDVTEDVISVSGISIDTDSTDYKIGKFTVSNVTIGLNNHSGKYSDVDVEQSIFRSTRSDSRVRIKYAKNSKGFPVGTTPIGFCTVDEPVVVYDGLLFDESMRLNAKDDRVKFKILGREGIFDRVEVPFSIMSVGDLISVHIFNILNQTEITDLFTLDIGNIVPALDYVLDDISDFENQTVAEAMDQFLFLSNSVMRTEDETLRVSNREPSAAIDFTFFGQNSAEGPENITSLMNISSGKSKLFNFFTWNKAPAARVINNESAAIHGIRKRALDEPQVTDLTKRVTLQRALLDEFEIPKQEFELTTPATYDTVAIRLLDRIGVDYPVVYIEGEDELPICGLAICGEAVLPDGLWSFSVPDSREFKVIKKTITPSKAELKFKLREI